MHAQQGSQEAGKERGDAVMLARASARGPRRVAMLFVVWLRLGFGCGKVSVDHTSFSTGSQDVVHSADSPLTLTEGEEQASLSLL